MAQIIIRPNEYVVLVAHVLVDWNHPDYEGGEQTVTHAVSDVKLSDVPERLDQWLVDAKERYPNAQKICLENWYIETI